MVTVCHSPLPRDQIQALVLDEMCIKSTAPALGNLQRSIPKFLLKAGAFLALALTFHCSFMLNFAGGFMQVVVFITPSKNIQIFPDFFLSSKTRSFILSKHLRSRGGKTLRRKKIQYIKWDWKAVETHKELQSVMVPPCYLAISTKVKPDYP